MALTNIQREICRLIARQRIASGESYVAGGAALNTVLHAPRISQDLDLFHDTAAALAATWNVDRTALLDAGYQVEVVRERPTFVEAIVRREIDMKNSSFFNFRRPAIEQGGCRKYGIPAFPLRLFELVTFWRDGRACASDNL